MELGEFPLCFFHESERVLRSFLLSLSEPSLIGYQVIKSHRITQETIAYYNILKNKA